MTLVKISLGDREITFDHIHCGVTEHDLEGVRIAAISQVVDGERVSEEMNFALEVCGGYGEVLLLDCLLRL